MAFLGTDVIGAVQAWWAGTPAVAALAADGKLWHGRKVESAAFPSATVCLASEVSETWTTAYPRKVSVVQINFHAATDAAARAGALAIRAALQGAPLVINEIPVGHVLPDGDGISEAEGLGPGGRDCWMAFETFEIAWTTQ